MKKKKNLGKDEELDESVKLTEADISDISDDGSDVSDDMDTFTLSKDSDNNKKPKKKKSGLKKRLLIMLIAVAVLAVVFTIVYFAAIKPIYDEKKEEENATATPEPMIEGEVRANDGISILLYKHTPKDSTKRVTVVNPSPIGGGEFNLVRNNEGNFYIKEHGEMAPITATTTLDVIVAAGYTVISRRVAESCDDLSIYGLADSDYPRKVTIEDLDGVTNTFYIGSIIPAEGGYYCRAEGRSAVYIINDASITPLLRTSESLIQPILGPVFDSNTAIMMDSFVLSKNGQRFVSIRFKELDVDNVKKSSYEMTYPAKYIVNDSNYSSNVLNAIATAEGYLVVAAGNGTSEGMLYKNQALMAQFGFYDTENPPFEVYYEYGDIAGYVMFTESGSDAYYYAYSLIWDTIILIEKSKVAFLEWDLLEYVNDRIFYEYIRDVSSLSISGKLVYAQQTHNINEKFTYEYIDDVMTCKSMYTLDDKKNNVTYTGSYEAQNYILAFYTVALSVDIEGYISEKDINFNMNDAEEYARFTIEYVNGETTTYVFYKFSGYCYFTIDGSGDFYVSTSDVNRLLVSAVRAANLLPVDMNAEYPALPDKYLERVDGK